MEFFKTDEGTLHRSRIAGVLILLAAAVSCGVDFQETDMCAARAASGIGFFLVLCGKRPAHPAPGSLANSLRLIGMVLLIAGVATQFYLTWSGRSPHL